MYIPGRERVVTEAVENRTQLPVGPLSGAGDLSGSGSS